MPVDRFYCEMTPESQMGFSQKSTCKALGLLPRTSSAHFGEYIVSDQYKTRVKSKSKTRVRSKSKSKSKTRVRSKSKSKTRSKSKSKPKHKSRTKSCGVCA